MTEAPVQKEEDEEEEESSSSVTALVMPGVSRGTAAVTALKASGQTPLLHVRPWTPKY
jgi:hypothetical protein